MLTRPNTRNKVPGLEWVGEVEVVAPAVLLGNVFGEMVDCDPSVYKRMYRGVDTLLESLRSAVFTGSFQAEFCVVV